MNIDDLHIDIDDMEQDFDNLSDDQKKELKSMEDLANTYDYGTDDEIRKAIDKHREIFGIKLNIL